MPIPYSTKANQRPIGSEQQIFGELHTVGTTAVAVSSPDEIRLIEVPFLEVPSTVIVPGFTEVTTVPGTNEFKVDYSNGRITFHPTRNGQSVAVDYKGRGSIVDAEDINELQLVFIGSVSAGNPTIGIANLDGTLSDGILRPNNISTVPTDDFILPRNLTITGDLTVIGTTTSLQTETLTIDDNIILLNSNVTGAPTEDAGLEIERGTLPNVQFLWDETLDGWRLNDTTGNILLLALDSGEVNLAVATVFGVDTASDPGSITVSQVDTKSGFVITTTVPIVLTMPSPTNTLEGRFFTVVHQTGSSGTLTLDGKSINIGQGTTLMWDGTAWSPVGGGAGGFSLVVGDPGSPAIGDTWFNSVTSQFKGFNGTSNVILG